MKLEIIPQFSFTSDVSEKDPHLTRLKYSQFKHYGFLRSLLI